MRRVSTARRARCGWRGPASHERPRRAYQPVDQDGPSSTISNAMAGCWPLGASQLEMRTRVSRSGMSTSSPSFSGADRTNHRRCAGGLRLPPGARSRGQLVGIGNAPTGLPPPREQDLQASVADRARSGMRDRGGPRRSARFTLSGSAGGGCSIAGDGPSRKRIAISSSPRSPRAEYSSNDIPSGKISTATDPAGPQ